MEISADLALLRKSYESGSLDAGDLLDDPIAQFGRWMSEAIEAGLDEPNAMTLATASAEGVPSARIVLLRGFDSRGFVFYTNYESAKGGEMLANPQAALVWYWQRLERQVRVQGPVERVAAEESDAYFASRPRGHQLSAWTSPQSQTVDSREVLAARLAECEARFPAAVPRPPFWGGYRVAPRRMEFWQGRKNRLHDRFVFENGACRRLAP